MFDHALITAAQSGDPSAVDALLTAALPVVERRVGYILGHDEDADDVVQLVMVKVWRKLHTYQSGNFEGWLVRIATNTCYDLLRSRHRRPLLCWDSIELIDDEADPLDLALRGERAAAVRRAVELLGGHYGPAVAAVDLGELEYMEAADALGVPLGTLKSRVHRGRQALAMMLSE